MAYEPVPNRGALFKNKRKTADNHPDYKGELALPSGQVKDIAAWIKVGKDGGKYMSLVISDPRPRD